MNLTQSSKLFFASMLAFCLLCVPNHASAQYFVDCSGNTPWAYTTINSVLAFIYNGAVIQVTGTCNENVSLNGFNRLWMGAPWGQTMNLQGSLTLDGVSNSYFYGMIVTSYPYWPGGITIASSHGIVLDTVSSINNGSSGLYVENGSEVSVVDSGSYSNNGSIGIYVVGNPIVQVSEMSAPILVSNNMG